MLSDFLRTVKACIVFFGVLLSLFAIFELLRMFQTLYSIHPAAGYVFLVVLAGGFVWLFVWFFRVLGGSPRALTPPATVDIEQADLRQLRRWARYQLRFLQRLTQNPFLDEKMRGQIQMEMDRLTPAFSQSRDFGQMHQLVLTTEEKTILPALDLLDRQASRQVRDCVRDVMLGVTLSPYKSADIFIVLYRNVLMTGRIIQTYNTRPALGQTIRIGIDILNIVATVNYINMGKNLIEALASKLPGVGRLTDDIAQGIGAGFMTSIAGHAAMDRCRSFRRWNPQAAKAGLLNRVGDFYADVRDIFFSDVWGFVKVRSSQATDQARDAIGQALDQTARTLTECVRIPVRAVAATGQTVAETTVAGTKVIRHWFSRSKPPKLPPDLKS
ncbi:MAG TPA: DUF697 domain-containing protein [Anaerohalosphaeraceae bacterium]|nr:DUF697 domain-containing protein [Anaerohalosphaeraceae bacterium]